MLIDEPAVLRGDPILNMIGKLNGNTKQAAMVEAGVYIVPHFGGSGFLREYEHWDIDGLSVGPYGVCDSPEQLLERCPELKTSERQFVVTLTPVVKAHQPDEGGWRWHKWGEYIGEYEITTEYLYDEPKVEQVFCYQIYERKG